MSTQPTIAVVHASIGSGHRIAAESIAAELQSLRPDARVEVLDILDFGVARISGNTATTAFTGPTAPLYDAMWGSAWFGSAAMAISRPLLGLLYSAFTRWIAENRPTVIVATHALAANLAVQATRGGRLGGPSVVACATDFGLHGFWPRHGLTRFCVADEAEAEELVRRGTPEGEIRVTGIPVRAQFEQQPDREVARAHLDLPTDHRVVLALAGATQPGPYERFKESLAVSLTLIASIPKTTVVVVTGRDEQYASDLRARVSGFGARTVKVLGYVENMAEVMAASDVSVCKPGGLVTAECVALQLPMVLIGPASGQERANVEALTAAGAAVYDADPRRMAEFVRKVLARPGQLARSKEATVALARPAAARAVVTVIEDLLG